MRIGITGATGFIGGVVGKLAATHGHEVVAYTRDPAKAELSWASELRRVDVHAAMPLDASGIDVLVHLAGETVLGFWTAAKKQRIRDSRVELTQRITRCLAEASPRPRALLCASGSGFYGNRGDESLDESSSQGDDFLASVCIEWEAAARRAEQLGMRVVMLRTGFVMGQEGGAWPMMKLAFNSYVGGRLGDGKQWMPWIHVQDEARLILWAAEREDIHGPLNLVAPNAVTNADFTKAVAKALECPAFMHAPKFILKLVLQELADGLMASQRVAPAKAIDAGFQFDYPTLDLALAALLAK